MGQYTFQVDGMQCAGCEQIIESELKSVRGALTVDADHERGVVESTADPGTRDDLVTALDERGYSVQE
jgi:copper chaperone CopZ